MIFISTLYDFWRLLDRRRKFTAVALVPVLAIAGGMEIAGMIFLFGYISALSAVSGGPDAGFAGHVFESVAGGLEDAAFALVAGLILVGVFAIKNVLWLASSFALLRFSMKQYEHVASTLFDGYQEMPLELMRARGMVAPLQTLNSTLNVFTRAFSPLLQAGADIAILCAMLVALMWAVDPVLVIGAVAFLGLTAFLFLAFTRRLSLSLGSRLREAQMTLTRVTDEAMRGLIDVRLAGRQDVMHDRYATVIGEFAVATRRSRALGMVPRALNEMVLATGIALTAVWFANSDGGLSGALATLAVLGFAGLRVTAATARLTHAAQELTESAHNRRKLMETIERTAPGLLGDGNKMRYDRETYRPVDRPLPEGDSRNLVANIEIMDISFRYPGAKDLAVDGISLDIPAGSFVGFCGESGGGKSTLALLIMGLLKPQSGRVLCDGWDVNEHISAWHRQIGYVGQAPFFSRGSVRENVAFGLRPSDIDDDAVWRALETAAVDKVFRSHPDGINAKLGDDGTLLSGGQRQRVAIARALYHDPTVLVFDEATAALDTVTEREVSNAIVRLRGDRTIIAIAHRISTIETADEIYLVEGGRIAARGNYSELLGSAEAFRKLAGATM